MEVGIQVVKYKLLIQPQPPVLFPLTKLNHSIHTLVALSSMRALLKNCPATTEKPLRSRTPLRSDHYSVPHQHAGKTVECHTFDNRFKILAEGLMITSHP
ncbi:MAG: Mu transposase domain-containing protein [Morganella morganii]